MRLVNYYDFIIISYLIILSIIGLTQLVRAAVCEVRGQEFNLGLRVVISLIFSWNGVYGNLAPTSESNRPVITTRQVLTRY